MTILKRDTTYLIGGEPGKEEFKVQFIEL